tara:strand:- start:479 stop:850 length:372 start_codon:yes stop_codon:yes gene_type:complete
MNNAFKPTTEQRKQVEAMCGYGIPVDDIAKVIINPHTTRPVCKQTMYNHFRAELATGMTKANAKVAESIYKAAVERNNMTAAIWWSKARMGWSETQGREMSGELKISWDAVDEAITAQIDADD